VRGFIVAFSPSADDDRGFRPHGVEKVDLHKADTDPPSQWRMRMPFSRLDGCLKGAAPCKYT